MAPSGESFRNTFFFLRMVQTFYRRYLQNTTNNVTGTQEDHDRSRYAAYSVKPVLIFWSSVLSVYTLLKVVGYYDLSVLSMSVMGFQKKVWMGGG